jgi:hypothetical protein
MPLRYEFLAQIVGATAGFHRYRAAFQLRREWQYCLPFHPREKNNRSSSVKARQTAKVLTEIDAKLHNLHGSALSSFGESASVLYRSCWEGAGYPINHAAMGVPFS